MNAQLRKNLVFNTAGSLLFYLCQAALNLLVTALAGVAANGMLATAMTIANVCLSVASFGMRTFQVSDLAGSGHPFAESVASVLAQILAELGRLPDCEEAERAREGDGSRRWFGLFARREARRA